MRRFVLGWKKLGVEQSPGTRLVTYADGFVMVTKGGSQCQAKSKYLLLTRRERRHFVPLGRADQDREGPVIGLIRTHVQ